MNIDDIQDMDEKEKIDFIREHGTEEQKDGLKSVFGRNQYKPKRKKMWKNQLKEGNRMIETILRKNNGGMKKTSKNTKNNRNNTKKKKKSKKKSKNGLAEFM